MLQIIMDFGTLKLFGFELPLRIFGYGLMLVLGFLAAIALARWRARRAGENPDVMTHVGLIALIGGIIGARAAYVFQHWQSQFAATANPWGAVLNITSGGLIYYGGLILGMVSVILFLVIKRVPLRRHLDIVTASLMVGLAFGRMGCLLNGCCYGASCDPQWSLGTTFPMYSTPLVKLDGRDSPFSVGSDSPSPVYQHQLSKGVVKADDHLVNHAMMYLLTPKGADSAASRPTILLPPRDYHGALERDQLALMSLDDAAISKHFGDLAGDDDMISREEWQAGLSGDGGLLGGSEHWSEAAAFSMLRNDQLDLDAIRRYLQWRRGWFLRKFDANRDGVLNGPERQVANSFAQADQIGLASASAAKPVSPAQVLGIINALLLAGLLTVFYRIRRREGQVFALLVVLYPITRFVLEAIRDDNSHNLLEGILTHNQYTSMAMTLGGVVLFVVLHFLPASCGPTWGRRLEIASDKKKQ